LWLSPRRERIGLFVQTIVDGYFDNEDVAGFLEDLLRRLRKPMIVVWDGGNMHKGDPIDALVRKKRGRLTLERLPPHTPDLMPMELAWSWLKYSRLCNYAPQNAVNSTNAFWTNSLPFGTTNDFCEAFFKDRTCRFRGHYLSETL
jgi:transposase